MKKRLISFASPFALLLFFLFFLLPFSLGLLFKPVIREETEGFDAAKEDLEAALEQAKERASSANSEEEASLAREALLYYQNALNYSVNVWESAFASEAVSLLAQVQKSLENASSEEKELLKRDEEWLDQIIRQGDREGLINYLEEKFRREGTSEEEISLRLEEATLHWKRVKNDAGKNLLLCEISLLKQSLREGINRYDPLEENQSLSAADRNRLEKALQGKEAAEAALLWDPIPANSELIQTAELLLALALAAVLTVTAILRERQKKSLFSLIPLGLAGWLGAATGLFTATALFAPDSLSALPLPIGEQTYFLPFFLRVLLRLLLQALPFLFFLPLSLMLLCKTGSLPVSLGVSLPLLLLFPAFSTLLRLRYSSWISYTPLPHWDPLGTADFLSPRYLPVSFSFFFSLCFTSGTLVLLFFFLFRFFKSRSPS